jgi:phage tail P2-like protein
MIKTLENFEIRDLLPESLKKDPEILAMADALTPIFQQIYQLTSRVKFYDGIPDELLDFIAYEENVDFYDINMTVEQKRALIERAQLVHRLKGTPAAIEEVAAIFFKNAKVREWFEYGGNPFFFKIETDETFKNESEIARLFRLIEKTKNKRSRLEGVWFKGSGGFSLQAIQNQQNKNHIHLQLIAGVSVAGKWPIITTLGRLVEQTVELSRSTYYTRQWPFRYAGKFFAGSEVVPETLNRQYSNEVQLDDEIYFSTNKFSFASSDLMIGKFRVGSDQTYEQLGSYTSTFEEIHDDFYSSFKTYLLCGTFSAQSEVRV